MSAQTPYSSAPPPIAHGGNADPNEMRLRQQRAASGFSQGTSTSATVHTSHGGKMDPNAVRPQVVHMQQVSSSSSPGDEVSLLGYYIDVLPSLFLLGTDSAWTVWDCSAFECNAAAASFRTWCASKRAVGTVCPSAVWSPVSQPGPSADPHPGQPITNTPSAELNLIGQYELLPSRQHTSAFS